MHAISSLIGPWTQNKLPELPHQSTHPDDESLCARTKKAKATTKKHADKCARTSELNMSDVVLVKQPKLNKISCRYSPIPMVMTDRKGSMVNEYHPKGPSITEAPQTSNVYQAWHERTSCRSCHQNLTFWCWPKPQSQTEPRSDSRAWPLFNCPRTTTTSDFTQENHSKTKETQWGDAKP